MPLTTSGPSQTERSHARSAIVAAGSNRRPDELGDGALEAVERRELERLGGEQVEPPGGMQRTLSEGLQRQGRRDGQAVAHVPQPRPGDRGVDGEHERLVAGGRGPGHEVAARLAVAPQVELEPAPPVRGRRGQALDRRRAHRRQRVRDADPFGDARDGRLALGVHHPGEAGRCEHERDSRRPPEDDCRGVHRRHVLEHVRAELDPLERLAGPTQSELVTGGAIDVVEDGARSSATGQHPQIGDGHDASQPPIGGVERRTPRPEQRSHLGPSRHASSGHGRVLHDRAHHRSAPSSSHA